MGDLSPSICLSASRKDRRDGIGMPARPEFLYANDPDTYTQGGGSAVFAERGPMDCPTRASASAPGMQIRPDMAALQKA